MFGSLFFIFWGPWGPLGAPGPPKIEFYQIFLKIIKNPFLFVALPGPASTTIFGFPVEVQGAWEAAIARVVVQGAQEAAIAI